MLVGTVDFLFLGACFVRLGDVYCPRFSFVSTQFNEKVQNNFLFHSQPKC
jgi:hypothetical protein